MQPQQDYYDPSLDGLAKDMQIVLKGKVFKPLRNVKTGNFFSYSYGVAERNKSANMENDIEWLDYNNPNIPKDIRDKVREVKELHEQMVILHVKLKKAAKFKNLERIEELEEEIKEFFMVIDEAIYPKSERKYIESKEAERFRLDQQGELKLDAASIAALTGNSPSVGSSADASIAEAKLEVATNRINEMQKIIDAQAQAEEVVDIDQPVVPAPKPAAKPAPRKKAAAKKSVTDDIPLHGA